MTIKKKKEDGDGRIHELTEMDVQFISLVDAGANRETKFLMVKSGETFKSVPDDDASQDEKERAQKARSQKYGIEVLNDSQFTYPSGSPTSEDMYGDPVNLSYPLGKEENAVDEDTLRSSIEMFKKNYESYSDEESRSKVYKRIVEKAVEQGIDVSFDSKDPVDALLPVELKEKLFSAEKVTPPDSEQTAETDDEDSSDTTPPADMGEWLDAAGETVEDMLAERALDQEVAEPLAVENKKANNVGKGFSPSQKSSDDGIAGRLDALEKENARHKRALRLKEEALRREQLRSAKYRKGAIGKTSVLRTGEDNPGRRKVDHEKEELMAAWTSGKDLSGR